MRIAITRPVSASLAQCLLTHLQRQAIDLALAHQQHAAYESALEALGCQLVQLPEAPDLPDAVFVEDTAIVLDELAVITRPGAPSRRAETEAMAQALRTFRPVAYIRPPGTLDGGDVLRLGKWVYVCISSRSNSNALAQLQHILQPYGYIVNGLKVQDCLHLKSAVTQISPDLLLINPNWVSPHHFAGMKHLAIDPSEAYAANAVWTEAGLVYPASFPHTLELLEHTGLRVLSVDVSELQKAEGAVTCCSLLFEA